MRIDGETRVVGVFGDPIKHSASPAMHNAAFEKLRLNWRYLPFHVLPDKLEAALHGVRDMGLVGVNLTVPHKIFALALVDEVDPVARQLGAVNTVHVVDGRLVGHNTDGYGLVKALREAFGLRLKGKRVTIIGAGGAGRAVTVQCAMEGVAELCLFNRTTSKAEELARELHNDFGSVQVTVGLPASRCDLLINATSVGLRAGDPSPIARTVLAKHTFVLDMIYRPVDTKLLRDAKRAGCRVTDGLGMLLHQGARAFEIWTGRKAPVEVMRSALRRAVHTR